MGSPGRRRVATATWTSMVLMASLVASSATSCGPDERARTPEVSSSPSEVTDEVFESQTNDVIDMAGRSGGERCELAATSPLLVSPPADAHQRELLAAALEAWSTAASPHLGPEDAALLGAATEQLRDSSGDGSAAEQVDGDARAVIERFVDAAAPACGAPDASDQTVAARP